MELIFNHSFGKQEQQDLVHTSIWAFAGENEDGDMLDNGWLLLDHPYKGRECWYQCRSVRIDGDQYKPRFPKHEYNGDKITVREIFPHKVEDLTLLPLQKIYKEYLERKGFRDLYDPFQHINARTSFLLFECGGKIVGFTKIKKYFWEGYPDDYQYVLPVEDWDFPAMAGIETVLHASSLPISAITADLEIQWSFQQGASYVYLGAGYERGSEYKASYKGFEWWTGEKWSRVKKTYRKLCKRDSDLELISDLRNAK